MALPNQKVLSCFFNTTDQFVPRGQDFHSVNYSLCSHLFNSHAVTNKYILPLDENGFYYATCTLRDVNEFIKWNPKLFTSSSQSVKKRISMFQNKINTYNGVINNRMQSSDVLIKYLNAKRESLGHATRDYYYKYENLIIRIDADIVYSPNNFAFNNYLDNFEVDKLNHNSTLKLDEEYESTVNKFKGICGHDKEDLGSRVYQYINKAANQSYFKYDVLTHKFKLSFIEYLHSSRNIGKDLLFLKKGSMRDSRSEKHKAKKAVNEEYQIYLIDNLCPKGSAMAERLAILTMGVNKKADGDDDIKSLINV